MRKSAGRRRERERKREREQEDYDLRVILQTDDTEIEGRNEETGRETSLIESIKKE